MGMPTASYEEDLKELSNEDQWAEGSRRQGLGQCKEELSSLSQEGWMASFVESGAWRPWASACAPEDSGAEMDDRL